MQNSDTVKNIMIGHTVLKTSLLEVHGLVVIRASQRTKVNDVTISFQRDCFMKKKKISKRLLSTKMNKKRSPCHISIDIHKMNVKSVAAIISKHSYVQENIKRGHYSKVCREHSTFFLCPKCFHL